MEEWFEKGLVLDKLGALLISICKNHPGLLIPARLSS
jgi:hypothetical protein